MSTDPDKIVEELLGNPDLYKAKAAEESAAWGKVFSNEKQIEVRARDKAAAVTLKSGRDRLSPIAAIRRQKSDPQHCLSLACGSGRAERHFLGKGIGKSFHGIDVAEGALGEARKLAAAEGLPISYEAGDLNQISLAPDSYDLVVTQNCLHHVLRLEHLAAEIHKSMTPGGLLWISDYVGETQFQYSDKRLAIANAVLQLIPEKLRTHRVNGRVVQKVTRPVPGELASPFEAIRSGEIMPVFLEKFDVVEKTESGGIMRLIMPLGARHDYTENEDTLAVFNMLQYLDRTLIREGVLPATGIQCLLRPKS